MADKNIKYLKDYTAPTYLVKSTDLTFTVNADKTVYVKSVTNYTKNPEVRHDNQLHLSGSAKLIDISLDEALLVPTDYMLDQKTESLIIKDVPDEFILCVTTLIEPWLNKSCMGLYASNNNLLTQCEAQGFRKITYYQDRPDVLAIFTTTIITQANHYSVVLSNGNKVADEIQDKKRITKWVDPFKKPCYLFALVIGNFALLKDSYLTRSNRKISLEIYTEAEQLPRAKHAMDSLKKAMLWDEERFNLEYDLDTYMIVATSDFNMGAMENKGLNIFNTKYVLADKDTATDTDFINIELVVGHEYFHNWTGNRVTCRDWFQLSLKEGLTVFRDQEFTADLHDRGVKRISDVKKLRQLQFAEDNGPLAHSVRPESYIEINNFYTNTVYNKGAEVVRMYQSILGREGFNKGLELYIKCNDGKAATCEDFCQAMMDANNFDLRQFMLWYSQAGTPQIKVVANYDSAKSKYSLTFKQTLADTPGQTNKQPLLIPVNISLFEQNGYPIHNLELSSGKYVKHNDGLVLLLDATENQFIFKNIKHHPIPSLFRGFSAPVRFEFSYTNKELLTLVLNETDAFNRYEYLQKIFSLQIKQIYTALINKSDIPQIDTELWSTLRTMVGNESITPELRALALQIPTFFEILSKIDNANPAILTKALNYLTQVIGENLFDTWIELYNLNLTLHYNFADHGKRSLKNTALFYIMQTMMPKLENTSSLQLIETMALGQFYNADNMTDQIAVLNSINDLDLAIRNELLDKFYQQWQNNELVMDKWFSIQAASQLVTIDTLNKLLVNPAFIATNPNKIYALLRVFTLNGLKFNTDEGYTFIADQIIAIDKFNPQVASTLASSYSNVIYLQESYRKSARIAIQKVLAQPNISGDVYEVMSKTLKGLAN